MPTIGLVQKFVVSGEELIRGSDSSIMHIECEA